MVLAEKFKFTNQKEYELISRYVLNYIKYMLLVKCNLDQLYVPRKESPSDFNSFKVKSNTIAQCDIYTSKDFTTNKNRLLCLIQGTGSVRAG